MRGFEPSHDALRVGDLSPVVEDSLGFYVLQLRHRVPAVNRSLEESRTPILHSLSDEARDRKLDELVASIGKTTSLEVFKDCFAKVHFEATEPAGGPPGPLSQSGDPSRVRKRQ